MSQNYQRIKDERTCLGETWGGSSSRDHAGRSVRATWAASSDAHFGLVESGAGGRLENDVVAGVALVELEFDFLFEVVLFVLGFPVAVGQVEGIDQCAVDDDGGATGALDAVLGDEGEMDFAAAFGGKGGGGTDGSDPISIPPR